MIIGGGGIYFEEGLTKIHSHVIHISQIVDEHKATPEGSLGTQIA